MTLKTFSYDAIFYSFFQTLKLPKIAEDNSDFDEFWTELIVMTWTFILATLCFFRDFFFTPWNRGSSSSCVVAVLVLVLVLVLVVVTHFVKKITKNWFPRPNEIARFLNLFFDVLGVAKRRRRLEFWRRVALDFQDDPERPDDERNRFFLMNFHEKYEKIFKKFQKISRSLVFY